MKRRVPLFTKVLLLSFLNRGLLGLVFALFVRAQFRLDTGSFLLAPAQNRIMAVANTSALELDGTQPGAWDQILGRHSGEHGVGFQLFDEEGGRLAGAELRLPPEVAEKIPRRQRPRGGPPPQGRPRQGDEAAPEGPGTAARWARLCSSARRAPRPATGRVSAFQSGNTRVRTRSPEP